MTTKEFREKILESKNLKWFKNIKVDFQLTAVNFSKTFKSLSEFHKFLELQKTGFENIDSLPDELKGSKDFFTKNLTNLEVFFNRYQNSTESQLDVYWKSATTKNNSQKIDLSSTNVLTFDSTQTDLLIRINETNSNYTKGAYDYITNAKNIGSSRDSFIGGILAYEFENPKTLLAKGDTPSKRKIQELENRIENQLSESESQLLEHLESSKNEFEAYVEKIDELKTQKESLFNDWFEGNENLEGIKSQITQFFEESKGRRENLEIAYDKKLELSKPARYWQKKANTYFDNYKTARTILLVMIGVTALFLGIILAVAPEYIFKNVFKGNEVTIVRWSLIFIAFLALMAYAIRAVNKFMFSSLHLSRDAEERHALTFVYLSLLNEQGSEMDGEDRKLILQSLFSRSETGLLKDDSGPTMPNDIISKIINK
ncbi:hypothetical protein ED312_03760 [Sinomicrobium pectinilyticum]|uniref:DUF6161 domain-containing protein n=1 Tax=Sinomicrobium pectinilyticum TaxID=1084421 RepID=A0A3N0EWK8_SINP1|nr:DUF6161 domain-containing protein [Sinomicrobium pectinilyticum]RNL92288.1 hypothetical protein ED312_03760 [Sinomicrobium pectinilyticum]